MRTRSQARRRRQPQVRQTSVESPNLEKPNNNQETFNPPIVTMDDNRTMAQLLEAPTEGYEDAIVVPEINANNFEIKHGLLNLAGIGLDKEPPRSILTWDDLVSKFINKFFPPSKTTNLRNEITRFQQRFDESFYEAWDRFNDLLRACPHHGFSELHQLDTFYNALNTNDQDSLNSAAGGNFLDKMPNQRPFTTRVIKPAYQAPVYQASIPQTQGVSKTDFDSYVKANDAVMRNMQNQNQVLQNQGQNLQTQLNNLATSNQRLESMLGNFIKMNTASTSGSGTLPGNTITNPKEDLKGITTRSGVAYQGPTIPSTSSSPPKVMNHDTEVTKDTILPTNNGSTEDVQPPVVQVQSQNPTPVVDPVSAPRPNQQTSIPFPSRRNDERRREKANDQIEKFYEIFRDLSFKISFTDALTLMLEICLDF
ncbi:reverse transcriptase domain-containing protein [Tanacetum coccineum]